jgi:hypothetical protein
MNSTTHAKQYQSYRGLPALAGLCSMERAVESQWSVETSTSQLKRIHYLTRRLHETLTARITAEPIYELKTAYSHHAYLLAEYTSAIRKRVSEMRVPPLGLEDVPHDSLKLLMDEIISSPTTETLLVGAYEVVLAAILDAAKQLQQAAHPLADASTWSLSSRMLLRWRLSSAYPPISIAREPNMKR